MNIQYEEYLKSGHWSLIRTEALNKANRRCEYCRAIHQLHGHHLRYRNLVDCTSSDVMILCETCHDNWHQHFGSRFEAERGFVAGFLAGLEKGGHYATKVVRPKRQGPKWPSIKLEMSAKPEITLALSRSDNYRTFKKRMRKLFKANPSISHYRHYMRKAFEELKPKPNGSHPF